VTGRPEPARAMTPEERAAWIARLRREMDLPRAIRYPPLRRAIERLAREDD
jgi:hypothetical protein